MPFFFSFMLIKNEFSVVWAMSYIASLCLLVIIIHDWLLVSSMIVLGFSMAYALTWFSDGIIHLSYFQPEYVPIWLFVLVGSIVANHRHKLAELRAKIKLIRGLAGSIAHEMRNPLAQIHGNLYLIEELQKQIPYLYGAKPIVAEHIKNAQRVIQSGLQVIDITLDAIADKPVNTNNFQLLSAQALVEEAVTDYAYEEEEHANLVSVEGEDFKLIAEPVMVKYVLYNLIQNALWYVKALPDAKIVISLKPTKNEFNQIEVRDTGPGIAPEALSKLFDSFYTSGKQGGTGLGLSYCKRTMTALGGDIRCESELDQYTVFTLSLPWVSAQQQMAFARRMHDQQAQQDKETEATQRQEQASTVSKVSPVNGAPEAATISLVSKTVLVAEDDNLSRKIVKAMVEKQGMRCLEAENGQVALDLLAVQSCDLIITDMKMPLMNGLELIETLRKQQTKGSNTDAPLPVIVVTAEKDKAVNTALQAGACDYLSKPIRAEKLIPKLQQWLVAWADSDICRANYRQ